MTRRITVAMVAVVVATLAVAGVMTFVVTQARAARATEESLARQLDGLGVSVDAIGQFLDRLEAAARARQAVRRGSTTSTTAPPASAVSRDRALDAEGCPVRALRRALQLRDAACVLVEPDGAVVVADGYPAVAGLPERLDSSVVAELVRGRTPHGVHDGTAWAARAVLTQPRVGSTGVPAIVLSQDVRSQLAPVRRWLLLAALVALALGVGVAVWLGRRLARPLIAAQQTTARIAAGDLAARLPERGPAHAPGDELADLARSINQMAASLEQSRGMEQQFLLSVSHDLRTPLTSIRGYAEALADGTLDDVGRGAAVIEREAGRLERLVGDLLDLARLESHQFDLELRPLDLVDIGRAAVAAFEPDARRDGLSLSFAGPMPAALAPAPASVPASVPVLADADRLGQVAANLVENALKYAASVVQVAVGSTDDVRVDRTSGGHGATGAWLAVSDDGPGIADADLPHVFERLYVSRSQPSRKESGSGLGLAIVRELVTAMGGTVRAGPLGPGRGGTRIEVRLPLASPRAGPRRY